MKNKILQILNPDPIEKSILRGVATPSFNDFEKDRQTYHQDIKELKTSIESFGVSKEQIQLLNTIQNSKIFTVEAFTQNKSNINRDKVLSYLETIPTISEEYQTHKLQHIETNKFVLKQTKLLRNKIAKNFIKLDNISKIIDLPKEIEVPEVIEEVIQNKSIPIDISENNLTNLSIKEEIKKHIRITLIDFHHIDNLLANLEKNIDPNDLSPTNIARINSLSSVTTGLHNSVIILLSTYSELISEYIDKNEYNKNDKLVKVLRKIRDTKVSL